MNTTPNNPNLKADDPFFFRTNQPRELLACAEFAAQQAQLVAGDPGAWRWLIISMTLGVQNACLCALDAGDPLGTKGMTYADARQVQQWRRDGAHGPKPDALKDPRIVSPLELLRRCGDPQFLKPPYQLPLNHHITKDFNDLVELRNTFLHFSQDGWTTDLREFPPLILSACGVIRHLAVTQPIYLRYAGRTHKERMGPALDTIVAAMEHYGAAAG